MNKQLKTQHAKKDMGELRVNSISQEKKINKRYCQIFCCLKNETFCATFI